MLWSNALYYIVAAGLRQTPPMPPEFDGATLLAALSALTSTITAVSTTQPGMFVLILVFIPLVFETLWIVIRRRNS